MFFFTAKWDILLTIHNKREDSHPVDVLYSFGTGFS